MPVLYKSRMADESTSTSTVAMSDSQEILIDFGNICRFCLTETDSTISINDKYVTEGRTEEKTIYDFVTGFSNIEIESPNGFPLLVCHNCWDMIQICHEFKETCQQSDTSLRECYSRTLEQTKAQLFPDDIEIKYEVENEYDDAKPVKNNNTLSNRLKEAQIKLKEDIKRSQYIMENGMGGNTCGTCYTHFFSEEDLKVHVETAHSKIITKCKFCPEMFLEGPNLTNHYKNVHKKFPEQVEGAKKFYCLSCEPAKSFSRRDSVTRHLKSAHGKSVDCIKTDLDNGENYECTKCTATFSTKYSVTRHLTNQHKVEETEIKQEDVKPSKEEDKIKLSKVYVCTDCFPPNTYEDMGEYIEHKKKSHDKDLENITIKELSQVYVPSINVFDKDETTKANIICKNCDPPVTFSSTRDFVTHLNSFHDTAGDAEIVGTDPSEQKQKWGCTECSATFSRKYNLRRHLKKQHGKTVKIGYTPCPDCDQTFLTNRLVVQHGITEHGKYYADLHDQYIKNILREGDKPEGDKKFECDICKKKYQLKDALRKHMKKEHLNGDKEEGLVNCSYCGKTFSHKANLKSHIEYVHEALIVSCPICQKEINFRALGKHYKTHQTDKDPFLKSKNFLCNLCGKVLKSKTSFEDHQKLHNNIRDHICDVCGEGFTNRKCLYIHKKIHEGALRKVFKCDKCDKVFNGRQSLHRHELTHSGTKDFVCEMCSKTFYTIQELKRHLRYHNKEYRFNCQLCDMKFFDKSRYRTHLMRHRNIRPHKCHFCDKVFIVRRKMHLHMAARHNFHVSDTKGIWKDPKTYVSLDDLL